MKTLKLAIALATLTSIRIAFAQAGDQLIAVPPPPEVSGQIAAAPEIQLAASQDQLKQAQRALASSQQAMKLAQVRAGEAGRAVTKTLGGGYGNRSGSVGRALIIPKDATDAKVLAECEEDMNVMAHILDKAVSNDGKSPRAMGIPVFGRIAGGGGSPQNLHIEGYGVIFFLNVSYPLLPAPDQNGEAAAKEDTNSEWEQARREMAQPTPSGGADVFVALGESLGREFLWGGGPPTPYDAEKVEELKSDLIAALKNAAHLRKLKSDEVVTVVVAGASASGAVSGKTLRSTGSKPGPGREEEVAIAEIAGERTLANAPAKLILRVRKSDAEAFQSGKLNPDEFRKKVSALLY
jgi:hypothetical protein